MWLLNVHSRELESFQDSDTPSYAILSHTWDKDEISFKDVQKRRYSDRQGYKKVGLCCEYASSHGYDYVWIDTCCIDKRSSAELSEAINSMYRWYSQADICYAYLSDISPGDNDWVRSRWFTRGWTLQELLAPQKLEFYDSSWKYLGDKQENWQEINRYTSIPLKSLTNFSPTDFSIAHRMSWASGRVTTRPEDRAYSLLGIFDVNMPLLYGEGGTKAFYRLQEEIMKTSTDLSIFAWSCCPHPLFAMLAESPDSFSLPWISADEYSQSRQAKFKSSTSDYVHTKAGISGTFRMRHHSLNIYAAEVGYIERSCIEPNHFDDAPTLLHSRVSIFLQYFPSSRRYYRVQFDGAYCSELSTRHDFHLYLKTQMVQISWSSPRAETSYALSPFACKQLALHVSFGSKISAGYLMLDIRSAQPSDATSSILFVSASDHHSFISGPCIVLDNNLYIHFGYNLQQKPGVFISTFEGSHFNFRAQSHNSALSSPQGRISCFESANSSKRLFKQPPSSMPSLGELLKAQNVKISDSCLFTFLSVSGGHRVLLSFKQVALGSVKNRISFSQETRLPQSWYTPEPLARELWDAISAEKKVT